MGTSTGHGTILERTSKFRIQLFLQGDAIPLSLRRACAGTNKERDLPRQLCAPAPDETDAMRTLYRTVMSEEGAAMFHWKGILKGRLDQENAASIYLYKVGLLAPKPGGPEDNIKL
jgi:hypothetical protein